jgi:hypothetical protein
MERWNAQRTFGERRARPEQFDALSAQCEDGDP